MTEFQFCSFLVLLSSLGCDLLPRGKVQRDFYLIVFFISSTAWMYFGPVRLLVWLANYAGLVTTQ